MRFLIDKQTINDLELFHKNGNGKTVFALFNYTNTTGGKKQLERFFTNPLTDIELIEQRVLVIRYFQNFSIGFNLEKECFDAIEYYFIQKNIPHRYSLSESLLKAFIYRIRPRNEYYIIQRGIKLLIKLLNDIYCTVKDIDIENSPDYIRECRIKILDIIDNTSLKIILGLKERHNLNPLEIGKLDYIFRNIEVNKVKEILEIIYQFDAFQSIVFASTKNGFTLPNFSNELNSYHVEGLFHPFLDNPISNNFDFEQGRNVCFLSGPNMAGKSTFLKSLSISLYLSHIGFPVPATNLRTSIFNGLLTTINLSDNINIGYSHFYSEVLRVKYVAEQINLFGNIFVVFDEIFRGTNVKDAYEASLAVIASFSKLNNSFFAISTHVIEVAEKLKQNNSIFFKYFGANMLNGIPHYSDVIKDGVTNERIGMYILEKEKILETIEKAIR
jgi:DNA mismatch repair protein MutS